MKVLSFGEVLWDKIDGEYYLGGAPLNFAAHAVKCGGSATIVSAVGNDTLGAKAILQADSLGVDTSKVQTTTYPTGTVDVFLSNGQPDYSIHEKVAFDYITHATLDKQFLETFTMFYFGSLAQRGQCSQATLRYILEQGDFEHVVYDINLRKYYYSEEIIRYSLHHCTVFKINNDESKVVSVLLYGDVLMDDDFCFRITRDFNVLVIIITAGSEGCFVYDQSQLKFIPPLSITLVDAIGAGDAFTAGFMYHYAMGMSASDAARIGNKLGAFVASSKGAIPIYSDDIKRLLSVRD